jgi:hypothetical protein
MHHTIAKHLALIVTFRSVSIGCKTNSQHWSEKESLPPDAAERSLVSDLAGDAGPAQPRVAGGGPKPHCYAARYQCCGAARSRRRPCPQARGRAKPLTPPCYTILLLSTHALEQLVRARWSD